MQKGDVSAAPNKLLHTLLAAHKIPICLQIVPTWQDFIQKSEPLARLQATAALRRHLIAAQAPQQNPRHVRGFCYPDSAALGRSATKKSRKDSASVVRVLNTGFPGTGVQI